MKKYIYFSIIISTSILFYSCKHDDKTIYPMECSTKSISQLKRQIVETGDTSAYDDLSILLMDYEYGDEELLSYAWIMANKYDYAQAYFDVFDCLTVPYLSDIRQIDSMTAQLAIKYLLIAAKKGHLQSSEIIASDTISENGQDPIGQLCKIFQ